MINVLFDRGLNHLAIEFEKQTQKEDGLNLLIALLLHDTHIMWYVCVCASMCVRIS